MCILSDVEYNQYGNAEAHRRYGSIGTLLVIKVSAESANQFGELVADPVTKELLHYAEKPETFVSDLINCGVYVFTPDIFLLSRELFPIGKIEKMCCACLAMCLSIRQQGCWSNKPTIGLPLSIYPQKLLLTSSQLQRRIRILLGDFLRLDQDILSPLAGKKQLYTFETADFWKQIKTPGMSLKCSALYLAQFRLTSPHLLASGDGARSPTVVGDVYIHPSAKVHPTAKIGPDVSISANVRIAAGVRLLNCIILDDVEIQENALVIHSIIGWKSSIGRWSRIQGDGDFDSKLGISILGESVTVEDEVVVINCIVLPNNVIDVHVMKEIIL
ncbi:hypothetical protein Dimus_023090 [Dionaea muscipula]